MNCLIIIETGVLGSEFLSCQVQYEIWEPTQYKVSVCLSFELNMKGLGRINLFFIVHREHLNEIKVKWTADSQGRAAPGSAWLVSVSLKLLSSCWNIKGAASPGPAAKCRSKAPPGDCDDCDHYWVQWALSRCLLDKLKTYFLQSKMESLQGIFVC